MDDITGKDYLHFNISLLQIARLYKTNSAKSLVGKVFDGFVKGFCISFLIVFLITSILDIKIKGALQFNLTALSYALLSANMCILQRIAYFYAYGNESENLIRKMNSFVKYSSNTGLEERSMKNTLRVVKLLTVVWIGIAALVIASFGIIPMFINRGHDRLMPFLLLMKSSPSYEITLLIHTVLLVIASILQTTTDVFLFALILICAEQFKILGWEFKHVVYTSLIENGVPRAEIYKFKRQLNGNYSETEEVDFSRILAVCERESFDNCMLRRISTLIQFHQHLLSFCNDLEDFFSPLMLPFYLVMSFLVLFMNVGGMMSGNISSKLACFPVAVFDYFSLLIPCFMVNLLTNQADKVSMDVYDLPWYFCSKKVKNCLIFILQKTSMPVTLTIGKFSAANLYLFLFLFRTINSYCIMIYQLSKIE